MPGKEVMYYIVWNKQKGEGYVTNDRNDALYVSTGKSKRFGVPVVGEAFRDAYEDDDNFEIQEIDLQSSTETRQHAVKD